MSRSVREALLACEGTDEQRRLLHRNMVQALSGTRSVRQRALESLRSEAAGPVGLVLPLAFAVRDELKRQPQPPSGIHGRFDALVSALADAEADQPGRAQGEGGRDGKGGQAGEAGAAAKGAARRLGGDAQRVGRMLRILLDHATDGVMTLRASGDVGLWNRAGGAITGRRRRDLVRGGPATLFRDPREFERVQAELAERGRLEPREVVLVRASGEEVPVRLYGLKLPTSAASDPRRADADRWLLFFHDLTEVHRIRRRLIETENLSAMAKIAGSVAHEFRNPLNSLFLSADLLEDELAGSGALQEAIAPTLAAIREEVERLNQIITHYLSLSKIASNAPEIVDLGELVQEFAEESKEQATERGIDLRVRIADGDAAVSVDPNQVRRVLLNLVENAFDAIDGEDPDGEGGQAPEGGRKGGIVTLAVRPMRRSVKIIVRDNGHGIPAEIRDRVFEPFFTSKSRGSGLGLYLVREIVLAHGGAISLAANGGRGTSVTTRWPRAEVPRSGGKAG